jgi:hypothetical protein
VRTSPKHEFLEALEQHLADSPELPIGCLTCGAKLIYVNADFQLYGERAHVTIPLGFCPFCDGLPAASDTEIA